MNDRGRNVLETVISVLEFKAEPDVPSNPRSTALFTRLDTIKTAMEAFSADQVSGVGGIKLGVSLRAELAGELREALRQVNETAVGLDPIAYPSASAQFRMPRSRTYQTLLATARAFLEDVGPIKAGFVESGMPADFDEKLGDLIAGFTAATGKKDGGRSERSGGTAGLDAKTREAVSVIIQLDSVMRNLMKGNDSLLGAWATASHIRRLPRPEKEPETPAPSATGTQASIATAEPATPVGSGTLTSAATPGEGTP